MLDIIRSLLIGFFVIALLLPVIRYALRRMSGGQAPIVLAADELKYIQRQEFKLMIAYYVFAAVLSIVAAGMLAMISSIVHASGQSHIYVLTPNFQALFAPGLLLGLTLALVPLRVVQSALLGQDYELYQRYILQQEGENSRQLYNLLFAAMLVVSLAAAWYAMRWHVVITAQQIRVTSLLQKERTYPIREVATIKSLGEEGEYIIGFTDAFSINTTHLKLVQPELIALISQQSGRRVDH